MERLMKLEDIECSCMDASAFEIYIFQTLNYQLRYISPEDYYEPFYKTFPYYQKIFRKTLPSLVDLALMHPDTCQFTS
jgi:hypothetical protein